MGTIETSKDSGLGLTMINVKGEITAKDIIDWIIEYYMKPATELILWDCTDADLSKGTLDDIEKIVDQVFESSGIRKGGKTALVFGDDNGYRLGTILADSVESNELGVKFRTFRDIHDAIEWLAD